LALLLLGCGVTEGAASSPEAARDRLDEHHALGEVEGWSVPGLRLFSVERDGPNPVGRRWVVGVEEASGDIVEGRALMARVRSEDPALLARRALSILLERHDLSPLRSGDARDEAISEAEWSLIVAPRVEGGELVFWALVEVSSASLREYRIDTDGWSVEWREAPEVLASGGGDETRGPSFCDAVARCGCWDGCERVQPVNDPHLRGRPGFRALEGSLRGQRLVRSECTGAACPRVCAVAPAATCVAALVPAEVETCEVSCPPGVAPLHCETSADDCRVVRHR